MSEEQQIYHSSTLGKIPLTFTGRHLMQSLREAIQDAIALRHYGDALSHARGKLAQYISKLEKDVKRLKAAEDARMHKGLAPWEVGYEHGARPYGGEAFHEWRANRDAAQAAGLEEKPEFRAVIPAGSTLEIVNGRVLIHPDLNRPLIRETKRCKVVYIGPHSALAALMEKDPVYVYALTLEIAITHAMQKTQRERGIGSMETEWAVSYAT